MATNARRKPASDQEKIEEAAAATSPENGPQPPPPQNGVFVAREIDQEGQLAVDVQLVGDVKITEVHTVLNLGRRLVDSRLDQL